MESGSAITTSWTDALEADEVPCWGCQSNANQSTNNKIIRISRRQLTPFGHGRSAVLLECFAWGEMTFEIEMIVDRSMN
jgi:hypothetical protein